MPKGYNGKEQFSKAIETYYEMMGWDPETGVPKTAKLAELDLGWLTFF
jgi:aldehyde:ferredoxin oxidoreductase